MTKVNFEKENKQLKEDKEKLIDENKRLKEVLEKIIQYADLKKPIPDSTTDTYVYFDTEDQVDLYISRIGRIGAVAEMALDIW